MKKKITSAICKILLLIISLSFVSCGTVVDNVEIEIVNIVVKEKLEQTKETVVYTGISESEHFISEPKKGNNYVILNLLILNRNNDKYNKNNLKLNINGEKYSVIKNDKFIENFGYNTIPSSIDGLKQQEGYLIFEVPEEKALTDYANWKLEDTKNNVTIDIGNIEIKDNIPKRVNISEKQLNIDSKIISEYSQKEYTIDSPYVINNPYGNAPLTALVLFKTEEEYDIKVTIKGKNEAGNITYNLNRFATEHEVPIVGLYANKTNNVKITATDRNGQIKETNVKIKTEEIDENVLNREVKVVEKNVEKMEDGLTFLMDSNRVVVDSNGDVRWYLSDIDGEMVDTSGVDEMLSNGRMLMSTTSYELFATIYEVDWLGKVHWSYSSEDTAHHEAEELPNGNILYASSNGIVELDKSKNDPVVAKVSFEKILENPGKSLELRGEMSEWFHINSIEFIEEDEAIIVSSRNQHAVVKLKYPSLEIEWVLGVSKDTQPNLAEKFLQSIGDFQWFYSQHQPTVLPDLDNNNNTMDILLFDNGVHRSLNVETAIAENDMYSRIVHYRINEQDKTVEQIFEFGKEKGLEFYSDIQSGAQYLGETGNYLATFDSSILPTWSTTIKDKNKDVKSHIVEVDKDGNILFQIDVNSVYRSYREKEDVFSKGYGSLGEVAQVNINPQESTVVNIPEAQGNLVSEIISMNENNGYLNVEGYAFVENMELTSSDMYMVFENDDFRYYFKLFRSNTTRIPETILNVSEDLLQKYPNKRLGFKTKYINLNSMEAGTYKVKLAVKEDSSNTIITSETGYYYTKNGTIEENQQQLEKSIVKSFNREKYSLQNPLIINNPYETSPLTALALFITDEESKISIKVHGKDEYTDIYHDFEEYKTVHEIPIYGLYAGTSNNVTIVAENKSGEVDEKIIEIKTKQLPIDFQTVEVIKSSPEKMAEGLTFMMGAMSNSIYPAAIDKNGDVRWYINSKMYAASPIRRLSNGNIVVASDNITNAPYYTDGFIEMNLLGKTINKYNVEGFHHDVVELPNGNFIALANNPNKPDVVEDYIVEIDKETNNVIRSWDMEEILGIDPVADEVYGSLGRHDWLHINSVDYSEKDNALIISARHQDAIVKFSLDTNEIMWILSDLNDEWPEHLQGKLLKPTSDDFGFTYGQHAVTELDNGDLLIFDNGNSRSKTVEDKTLPNDNYSRLLVVKVNREEMTVSEIYEYGKERGSELFSAYVGDVDFINDNYLITFGGIISDNQGNLYDNPSELLNSSIDDIYGKARVVEINNGEEVFEVEIKNGKFGNVYRTERMRLYNLIDNNLHIVEK